MPNQPLQKATLFVPLYSGLQSEVVDKLVQPGNGVLELENMIAAVTGEMSKRDGSLNLTTPSTPVFPAGTSMPLLYELANYRSELVRLSVPGPNPLWSYLSHEGEWLNPGAATSTISSFFRGPMAVTLTGLVNAVTLATNPQTPDGAAVNQYALEAHEVFNLSTGANAGIVETIVDCQSLKPVVVFSGNSTALRPKCIAVGHYLLCFFLDLFDNTIRVDLFDTTNIASGANQFVLTSANFAGPNSLLEVSLRNNTTAMCAYTTSGGAVVGVDFVPSTAVITTYAFGTSGLSDWFATSAMGWMQDFGGSGKLAFVTQDVNNGVVVHWDIGAISAGLSLSAAEYTIDSSFIGTSTASQYGSGVWNLAAYTTSNSSTGNFVVMYDYITLGATHLSVVYRGDRTGTTLTTGAPYWYGTSLVSKFFQPSPANGTQILTSYSNSAHPETPQNTYFVCIDGVSQPVPLATVSPQATGGISRRCSSLTSVFVNPSTDFEMCAISTLADLQYVAGAPVQILGVSLLQVEALPQQDTSTSTAIEAFGSLIIPGATMLAYDGRTLTEAVFARRPEPPVVIPVNLASGGTATIAHSTSDRVIGAPVQPLTTSKFDVVQPSPTNIIHNSSDTVNVAGSVVTYNLLNGRNGLNGFNVTNSDIRGLNAMLVGGTITVASSGTSVNDGAYTITGVKLNGSDLQVLVTKISQTGATMGSSTTVTLEGPNPGRFCLQAPGIPVITADPTFANQLLVVTGDPSYIQNLGTYTLDGSAPCGTVTLGDGHSYFYFYSSAIASTVKPEEYLLSLPSISLQLADPTTANLWTIGNGAFDQTYVGSVITVANALNPGNNRSFQILRVIDATHIVTSGTPIGGGPNDIIRNEDLGATAGITYTVALSNGVGIGFHSYVVLYSCIDANGRRWTSPPSLPATVTTSVTNPSVTAIVQFLSHTGRNCNVELYRTQTGVGGAYNLVTSVPNNPNLAAQIINDNFTDLQVAAQTELFSDGGILPGTPLPGVSLVASFQGRLVVVSPEAPQSLLYSNPDSAGSSGGGEGVLFDTTNLSLDIIDTHGQITAIQPLDQNTLVVFKKDAVYGVTGQGPDGTGANGGYSYTLLASGVGTSNPRSVILQVGSGTAADGVWFQSNSTRSGWYVVTRGGTVEYMGQGVRRYSDETVVQAIVYPALTQLRWYTLSGRTLVYDWTSKLWSTNTGQAALAATMYQDVPVYAPSGTLNGYILQEIPGGYDEGSSTTYVPYQTKIDSPWLSLAQLKGFERMYRVQGVGRTVGAHTLTVNLYADYDDTNLIGSYTKTFDGTTTSWDWEVRPKVQKLDALKVEIITSDPALVLTTYSIPPSGVTYFGSGTWDFATSTLNIPVGSTVTITNSAIPAQNGVYTVLTWNNASKIATMSPSPSGAGSVGSSASVIVSYIAAPTQGLAAAAVTGISLVYGIKKGLKKMPDSNRMTPA